MKILIKYYAYLLLSSFINFTSFALDLTRQDEIEVIVFLKGKVGHAHYYERDAAQGVWLHIYYMVHG